MTEPPPIPSQLQKRRPRILVGLLGLAIILVVGVTALTYFPGSGLSEDIEVTTWMSDGSRAFDEGRWDDAVEAFTQVIELEPDQADLEAALWARSVALFNLGRLEDALRDETSLIDLQPADDLLAKAHLNRSRELASLERYEEALIDSAAAIEIGPTAVEDLAGAHMNRSVALHNLGRFDESLDEAAVVISLVPDNTYLLTAAHSRRMKVFLDMGVLFSPEVIAEATATIDLNSGDAETRLQAHLSRAFALVELERYDDAAADLRAVIALLPEDDPDAEFMAELLEDIELLSEDGQ